MDCTNCLQNGHCQIVHLWTGKELEPQADTCAECKALDTPCQKNRVTAGLSLLAFMQQDEKIEDDLFNDILSYTEEVQAPKIGPGTELKKMIKWFGISGPSTCKCRQRALQMNMWGPAECRTRIDEITGWLREEAAAQNVLFIDAAARGLIYAACLKAEMLPTKDGQL